MRETIPQIPRSVLDFCKHCDNLANNGTCLIRSITLEDRDRFVEQDHCGSALSDGIAVDMTSTGIKLKSSHFSSAK